MTLKAYKTKYESGNLPAFERRGGLQNSQFKTTKQKRNDWKRDLRKGEL